ncbi:hypothetical protein DID77_02380 [Candidatus Marinamargulisbacteria bacterium SCGC AG-439-L15]|nr:hypothetical protein DID77_02380 [Candidatus Marinamargulisbacteria bacterium SCGC AG-439-L15]
MINKQHPLKGFLATRFPLLCFGVGIIALILSLGSYFKDPHHFYFSYLTSFIFFLGLSMSAMFLVLIQHLTRAGWGIVIRRAAEHMMRNLPLLLLLFIPILLGAKNLYHWMDAHVLATDHLVQVKAPYLNKTFFTIRAIGYFIVWLVISKFFFKKSVEQDIIGGEDITADLQKKSAPAILLFALTYSFASFDWIMSLNPHWFSTIFGIYVFANSTLAALCTISLIYLILRRAGFLKEIVTIEHYHDLGKLIYGFVVFWTYIAFSQFFLIWYANIPEETSWFLYRLSGSWKTFTIVLVIGHFIFPLFFFMSRHVKRHLPSHTFMICFLLIMCYLDVYYLVMPTIQKSVHFSFADIACFIGIGGIYLGNIFYNMKKYELIPTKDPYIGESLQFKNH